MPNTLWEYYQQRGERLPSVQERLPLYQQYGITGTPGSAEANIQLLAALQGGGGATPATPAPTQTAAPTDLFSQYQPRFASASQQSQNLLRDYLAMSAQAPTFQQKLLDAIKQSEQWPSHAAMREEYIQNPDLTPMAIEALVSQRGQATRGTIQDIINRAYGGFQADISQKQMMASLAQQELENLYRDYGLEYQAQQDVLSRQETARGTEGERYATRIRQAAIADAQGGLNAEDFARKYADTLDYWELIDIYNRNSPYGAMAESPQTFREWAGGGGLGSWLEEQTTTIPSADDWGQFGLDFDFNLPSTVGQSARMIPYQGF